MIARVNRCVMVLLLLGCVPALWAAEPPVRRMSLDSMPEFKSAEDAQHALSGLRQMIWTLPEMMGHEAGLQERSRGLAADLEAVVLKPESLTALEAGIAAAGAAREQDAQADVSALLKPVRAGLLEEFSRFALLVAYWGSAQLLEVHMELITPLLERATPEDQKVARSRLQTIDTSIESWRAKASGPSPSAFMISEPGTPGYEQSLLSVPFTLNEVRSTLAASVAHPIRGVVPEAGMRPRVEACPPPVAPESTDGKLRVKHSVDLSDYYPAEMQRHSVEGTVRVGIEVSAEGCVSGAWIVQSSGAPALDEAGIRVAFAYEFVPASNAQGAMTVRNVLPVRFSLL